MLLSFVYFAQILAQSMGSSPSINTLLETGRSRGPSRASNPGEQTSQYSQEEHLQGITYIYTPTVPRPFPIIPWVPLWNLKIYRLLGMQSKVRGKFLS